MSGRRRFLAVAVGGRLVSAGSALGQEASFAADVVVTPSHGSNAWVGYIHAAGRAEIAYELLLEPKYDVRNVLVGWDLLMFRPEHRDENLLEPAHNWHGLQPFMFAADDLACGPEHSAFGVERNLSVRLSGATLHVRVLAARVSTVGAIHTLESLSLRIAMP